MSVQLQSRWLTTLVVGGRTFRFQTFTGGGVTSAAVSSRAPGEQYPAQGSGEREIAAITLGRDYDVAVDDDMVDHLQRFIDTEDAATVQRQPLDSDRNPFGRKRTWTGKLTGIPEPDSDTNSPDGKSVVTVEMQPSSKS